MKRASIFAIIAIVCFLIYLNFFPKITIQTQTLDKKLPILIYPIKNYNGNNDSLLVYLPYKIKVTNYSLKILKRPNFYFRDLRYEHHSQSLIYDDKGFSINKRSNIDFEYYKQLGKTYPLFSKTFYVYKYNIIAAKRINLVIDSTMQRKVELEFVQLMENLNAKSNIKISKKITDSLYQIENNKPFYFNYLTRPLWKSKIIPSKGYSEFENLYKLSKEEAYKKVSQPIE